MLKKRRMKMDKYKEMLERPNKKYKYSELELGKIISLLDYCHAVDVRMTHRRMYEVFFKCDALLGMELTIDSCSDQCSKYGCSNCTAAEDAECIINQEKSVLDLEPSDEFYFKDEVKSIFKRYHGDKNEKMSDTEIDMIAEEVKKELKYFNYCLIKGEN